VTQTVAGRGNGLLPVVFFGVVAASLGLIAGVSPILAAGIGALAVLILLPWPVLFALFVFAAIYSKGHGFTVAGVNLQYSDAILAPLAIRTLLFTNPKIRHRWFAPEYCLMGFVGMQFVSSVLKSVTVKPSLAVAGLLALGGIAYLTVYTGVCTRERLIFAAKVVLYAALLNATIGVVASLGHYATHAGIFNPFLSGRLDTHRGVSGLPRGLVVENNIYGSFTGAAALAFFVLMRERNPVFTRRFASMAFWICMVGLVLSSTRGAWIGFILAFAALLFFRRPHGRRKSPIAGVGVAAVLIALVAAGALWFTAQPPTTSVDASTTSSVEIGTDASTIVDFTNGTGASRLSEWKTAIGDLRRSPLIGLGTNSYGQRHLAVNATEKDPVPGYLGNLYVRTLYDTGIIGFLFLAFFLLPVARPRRVLQTSRGDLAPIARAFLFGYLVLAVAFAATDASFQPWPWVFLGLARAAVALATRQHEGMRRAALAAAPEVVPVPAGAIAPPGPFPAAGPFGSPTGPAFGNGRPGLPPLPRGSGYRSRPTWDPFGRGHQ
jgi:O-Antigen ligase